MRLLRVLLKMGYVDYMFRQTEYLLWNVEGTSTDSGRQPESRLISLKTDGVACRQPSSYNCRSTGSPKKGHIHLLRAFDRLAATNPDLSLVMVGPKGSASEVIDEELACTTFRTQA